MFMKGQGMSKVLEKTFLALCIHRNKDERNKFGITDFASELPISILVK